MKLSMKVFWVGLPRAMKFSFKLFLPGLIMQGLASKLRAVVHIGLGQATSSGELLEHDDDARAPDALIGPEGWTLGG